MIHKIFSVYDSAAKAYLPPWFCHSTGLALRNFSTAANDQDHSFSRYAKDFTLFELGEFDDEHAGFMMYNTPKSLGTALEYVVNIDGPGQQDLQLKADISDGLQTQVSDETPILRDTASINST